MLQARASAQGQQAGVYEVDRAWPKPLPNHWILGSTVGLAVDSRDHVWIVHRGKATIDPKFGSMMAYAPAAPRGGGAGRAGRAGAAPAEPAGRDAAAGETAATG